MTCENFDFMKSPHIGLVTHHWTGSYLRKPYGAHYRKYLRILSKKILSVGWAGGAAKCSQNIEYLLMTHDDWATAPPA